MAFDAPRCRPTLTCRIHLDFVGLDSLPAPESSGGRCSIGWGEEMQLRLLRLCLGFSAVAWGASVLGVVLPWPSAAEALEGLGARPIVYDPMLDYWLRMAAGAFTLVGGLYLVLMISPARFRAIIPWFGVLMLLEGVVLLVHGIRLHLPPLPFYADTTACLLGGAGILWFSMHADYGAG